ncbi:MAG: 5-formyltetrahydrofolate cyclo-ligase [Acetivibrionales bacterium]|jgi:5-formyltetrahydrofolate cyclo-ligase
METKSEIRKRILEERDMLDADAVSEKSAAIVERLCSLKEYVNAVTIMAYMSVRNEVRTDFFIKRCMLDGKLVAIPKVEKGGPSGRRKLEAYVIREPGKDLIKGCMNIPEPDAAVLKKLDPDDIDLVVVPGIAFDFSRYRIGYGAGCYDGFLPRLKPGCLKAGLAYEMQVVEKIPAESHDIPMDLVITEHRVI